MLILLLSLWLLWTPDRDLAQLQRSYQAAPTDRVTVLGTSLHVRDTGPRDAPAVLLIHGFASSLHTWEPWAQNLSQHMRVIRLDLPGHGLSSPDATGDYTDSRSVALLLALLDQLAVPRASVVGHSMGGRIAWTLAATHPERVDKLVLVAPDGFASPGFAYGVKPDVPATLQLMRFTLPKWLLRMNLAPAYVDAAALTDERATRYHDLMLAPGARQAMIARLQQSVLVDPVPLLQRISAPTLLIWGQQDALIPFSNAADYTHALARSQLVALDGVGHLPQEEAPERALAPLRDFLRSDN
ncbi:alpha/beta fold hydrolase [Rhodoferax sp. U2-2l]|uniref:alpha/beta fold hydrolase n=1 Tax=Rhodoferax sp. U2-2l TaxID=2884000 RepID=UPI001D0BCCB7|nr:alpha/beta fold hydrolase [Rhodoferax sp. U2-2l]MCB8746171.1 alpha/beta fold hydrolase [Rhodoferax sp. U2-2l]